jgi:uncharacterized repeat protein (TIGR03803 family)
MQRKELSLVTRVVLTIFVSLPIFTDSAFASHSLEKVIYNFQGAPDGSLPQASLIADQAGNLYGTTETGGTAACTCGTVFELTPPATAGGAWAETVLYSFQGGTSDGSEPSGTLVFDAVGNLYGTTLAGGNRKGTVFELSPPATAGGAWSETVLLVFPGDGSTGAGPFAGLTLDAAGNLYGTTLNGGGTSTKCSGGCGTVFELSPPATAGGAWTETVLYSFGVFIGDGIFPAGDLTFDGAGNLYGTTTTGFGNRGIVFQLVPNNGGWTENILHQFVFTDGALPAGRVLFKARNLYGTTFDGGSVGVGVVFKLTEPAVPGHPWKETTLYNFTGGKDGANPAAGLIYDKAGNLYGTASEGGLRNSLSSNNGTVFELSPPAVSGGAWTENTLHEFGGKTYGDGTRPLGGLILPNGKFYGTSSSGGPNSAGMVYSVVIVP